MGVPDDKSGEAVKLVIVKKDPSLTEAQVREFCKSNLTGYKQPKVVEFRDRAAQDTGGQDPAARVAGTRSSARRRCVTLDNGQPGGRLRSHRLSNQTRLTLCWLLDQSGMTRTAIVAALHDELASVLALMPDEQKQVVGGREFWVGHLHGQEVVAVLSGIGKVAAATTATLLIERFGVQRIVFTGVAGGLGPGVKVGDVVLARSSCSTTWTRRRCSRATRCRATAVPVFEADAWSGRRAGAGLRAHAAPPAAATGRIRPSRLSPCRRLDCTRAC